jgi:outer membrane protein assembly factor BamD
MKIVQPLLILSIITTLSACASLDDDPTADWSAEKLYQEANDALNSKNYQTAIDYYTSLQARYPFGRYAQQAELEVAYAYYKSYQPDSAIAAADRFIKLHPQNKHVDYAYYLKGLVNFDRTKGYLDFIVPSDPSQNDPTPLLRAFDDFGYLVRNYPHSRYAKDARQRMIYLRNELAEYELNVADYYMRRGAWVAAANRAKYVIERYQGCESMPQALGTMIAAYRKLGLDKLADDATRVLRVNFPQQASELLAAGDE